MESNPQLRRMTAFQTESRPKIPVESVMHSSCLYLSFAQLRILSGLLGTATTVAKARCSLVLSGLQSSLGKDAVELVVVLGSHSRFRLEALSISYDPWDNF